MQKADAYQKVDTNRMKHEKDYGKTPPSEFRALVRRGEFDIVTCGCCNGFVQANLVILPRSCALLSFCDFRRRLFIHVNLDSQVCSPGI